MRPLTVTADDCGLSHGINRATVELYQKGIITAASVMTNFPAAQPALELFAGCPALRVGVHLNLSEGLALTRPQRSLRLTDSDGRFRPRALFLMRLLRPHPDDLAWIENELTAQIKVVTGFGLQPQHLTTHLQFHSLPALYEIVGRLAETFRISRIRPHRLRALATPYSFWLGSGEEATYVVLLKSWLRRSPQQLLDRLTPLEGAVELVVHPSLPDDDSFPEGVAYRPPERFREVVYLERLWQRMPPGLVRTGESL